MKFNDAIDELIAEGCTIIVDDITWPDEPFFEDGVVAQQVAEVIANNNICISLLQVTQGEALPGPF